LPVRIAGSETMTGAGGWLWPRRAFKVEIAFGAPLLPTARNSENRKIAAENLKIRWLNIMQTMDASPDRERSKNIRL
jgi:hypothetical protein